MYSATVLALLLCCSKRCQAFQYYSPNCTLPTPGTTYVAAGNVRSTLDILWTSLATIIACTYSVLHLNVPQQRNRRDPGWKGDLIWGSKGLFHKIKWSLAAICAPEYYLVLACREYVSVRSLQRRLRALGDAVHGGRQWSMRECFFISMGGYAITRRQGSKQRETIHLWQTSFIHLLEHDAADILPRLLSEDEICDRSKSDVFTKSLIILQVCYFCVTLFTRWAKQLPVTPLEVAAIAYTTCSVLTYGLFWHKSQAVTVVAIIAHCETELPEPLATALKSELNENRKSVLEPVDNGHFTAGFEPHPHSRSFTFMLAITAALFGAVHLAAWDSAFPTPAERWIWRVATLVTCFAMLPVWLNDLLMRVFKARADTRKILMDVSGWCCITVYVLARLPLIVEMFRALAYLPPEAYISTWTANVPHVG